MDQMVTYWVRDLSGKRNAGNVEHAAEIPKSGLRKLFVYLGISPLTNSVTGVADTYVCAYVRMPQS
jgi:hypothetical protein